MDSRKSATFSIAYGRSYDGMIQPRHLFDIVKGRVGSGMRALELNGFPFRNPMNPSGLWHLPAKDGLSNRQRWFKNLSAHQFNLLCFVVVLSIYVAGQILIGTRSPTTGAWTYSAPFNADILYYAAIANQLGVQIPPQNPNYAEIVLFQSWLPMLPVAWLMGYTGPYLAMKLLTIGVLIVFAFVCRKYYPDRWGFLLLIVLATASAKLSVPAFGTDVLFKGFYHLPIYVAFLVILFEKKHAWLRWLSLLLLPWLHGLSAFAIFVFLCVHLAVVRDRVNLADVFLAGTGMVLYKILLSSEQAISILGLLLQGIYFNPIEPALHVLIWCPFFYRCKSAKLWSLFCASFVLASFIHWNAYFFVYMLTFATALMVVDAMPDFSVRQRRHFGPVAALGVVIFVSYASAIKFSRDAAIDMEPFRGTLEWAAANTPRNSVFLVAPPKPVRNPRDPANLPVIQQVRALYYGVPYQVTDAGLDRDRVRYQAALRVYTDRIVPPGVDFVFYGPFERQRFPVFSSVGLEVYRDAHVRIYDVGDAVLHGMEFSDFW